MRELEITPEPDDPAIAAAIARAIERLESDEGTRRRRVRTSARRGPPRRAASSSTMASPDVLLGAGLYETVRVSDGVALHGERHLERMTASAHALGLPAPERAAFARAIAQATGAGDVVRVRLHAPDGEPELSAERRAALAPEPLRATALGGWYAPGYLLREHKLTSHFHGIQGRRLAQAAGYDDALLVTHDGRVGEATNANVAHVAGERPDHAVGRRAVARGLPRGRAGCRARARAGGGGAPRRARRAHRRRRRPRNLVAARDQRG